MNPPLLRGIISRGYRPFLSHAFCASASIDFINQLHYFCSWNGEIRRIILTVPKIFVFRISPIIICKVTLSFSSIINGASSSQRKVKILYSWLTSFCSFLFLSLLQNCVLISCCKKAESKIWLECEKKNTKEMLYFLFFFSFFLLCIFFHVKF